MNYRMQVVVLALGLLMSGCASTPTRVNEGPIKARTFSFVQPGAAGVPAFADRRVAMHEMIQQSLAQALARRGVQWVESGGDVTLAYLVIVGNNATTSAVNDYFGYGRDSAALANRAHQAMAIDNKNPNAFEAGTLVVDILDGKTYQLLMRNYTVRPLLRDTSAELRQERLNEVVEEVLRDVSLQP